MAAGGAVRFGFLWWLADSGLPSAERSPSIALKKPRDEWGIRQEQEQEQGQEQGQNWWEMAAGGAVRFGFCGGLLIRVCLRQSGAHPSRLKPRDEWGTRIVGLGEGRG
jgi:hypothetical protein